MSVIQLMSDLHLEMMGSFDRGRWLGQLDPSGVDILVLAGDICVRKQLAEVLKVFCDIYPQVVYVTGNHEYYRSRPMEVDGLLWDLSVELENLTWLDNRAATVDGVRFVGGTLWFPRPEDPEVLRAGKWQLNDFVHIGDFEPWVYESNMICEQVIKANLPTADVVVTHHMPSGSFVSPRFRTGPSARLNHYFCRDLTPLIEEHQPKLWVFGHTHDRRYNWIKDSLLVCNPKGYPHEPDFPERGVYAERCLIEIRPGESALHRPAVFRGDVPGKK